MDHFPWILPSATASLLCLVLALVIWKRHRLPVAHAFYWFLLSVFIWVFSRFLITLSDSDTVRLTISKFQYFGIAFTPLTWLIFSLTATGRTRFLAPRNLLLLSAVPLITGLLALTNDHHHLIWKQITFTHFRIQAEHGAWFAVHIAYSYLLIGAATLAAAIEYARDPKYRPELIAIVLAPLLVLLTNFNNLIHGIDFGDLDTVSIAIAFAASLFLWVALKENYLQLVPTARAVLVENMPDALIVLNEGRRIVDLNPAAERLLGDKRQAIIGRPLSEYVTDSRIRETLSVGGRVTLSLQGKDFEALVTHISARHGKLQGCLIVFRDISDLKQTQHRLESTARELEQANEELRLLASTDALTQLPNRHSFFERFARELARLDRTGCELCMLILDLDEFKQINDQYGHAAGDAVLRRISAVIASMTRKCDIAGRLGGEEFALIFPDTDLDGARAFAERLRQAIQYSHNEDEVPVTASMGLTQARKGMGMEEIYEQADQALYTAKKSGRNRVAVACG